MSIPYTSEYGATYYKTIGRTTGRVYEDTRNNVNDRWEREARKSYEENKAKGKLRYLKMNFRLYYCLLTEMSTGKQIAALSRYDKERIDYWKNQVEIRLKKHNFIDSFINKFFDKVVTNKDFMEFNV